MADSTEFVRYHQLTADYTTTFSSLRILILNVVMPILAVMYLNIIQGKTKDSSPVQKRKTQDSPTGNRVQSKSPYGRMVGKSSNLLPTKCARFITP